MYQTLGGINYDSSRPGFKHIIMRPQPVGDLTWVHASYKSVYGLIRSDWKVTAVQFRWKITVPANTTATLYIPTSNPASVKEGDRPVKEVPGLKYLGVDQGRVMYETGSGSYELTASFEQKKQ
jgi:alpha-L-rhamnosidase